MGDITLAILADQRHRNSLGAESCVALSSGRKYLSQCLVDLRVARREAAADVAKDVARIENGLSGGIGVNNTPALIDETQAGVKPIERIGECPGLRDPEIEHSGNQDRPANVRRDQPHAMTRFVVDEAIALMAEHPEQSHACCRSVENGAHEVDKALGMSPFPIERGRREFIVGHQVGSRDRLFDLSEKVSHCGGINWPKQCDRQRPDNSGAVR